MGRIELALLEMTLDGLAAGSNPDEQEKRSAAVRRKIYRLSEEALSAEAAVWLWLLIAAGMATVIAWLVEWRAVGSWDWWWWPVAYVTSFVFVLLVNIVVNRAASAIGGTLWRREIERARHWRTQYEPRRQEDAT
jgi:hypothetical protein